MIGVVVKDCFCGGGKQEIVVEEVIVVVLLEWNNGLLCIVRLANWVSKLKFLFFCQKSLTAVI